MNRAPKEVRHLRKVRQQGGLIAPGYKVNHENLRSPAWLGQAGPRARMLFFWLRLLVGLGALGLIITRIDLKAATLRPNALLLAATASAAGLLILSQAVAALRWRIVLDDDSLPWSYLLRLYIIGSFFGLFLPTSVGGDAVRAVAAGRSAKLAGRAIASVPIDRGFGVLATLAYAVVGLALAPDSIEILKGHSVAWSGPGPLGIGITLAAIGVGLLILHRSVRALALWQDSIAVMRDLARSPHRLARVLALAVLSQGLMVLLWYALARGMTFALPAVTLVWAVPIVTLSALIPVTFSGLGIREGVWLVLLAGSGIPAADIVAFSLLYFACNLLVGITGGILFVSSGTAFEPARDGIPVQG